MGGSEKHTHEVGVQWLVRVRWAAVMAETATTLLASQILSMELPVGLLIGIIGIQALSNVALQRGSSRVAQSQLTRGAILIADVWLLFGMLALSGGTTNPFSALFFVQVTLAAMLLARFGAALIYANAVLAYGVLFLIPQEAAAMGHHHHGAGASYESHLSGMFVAFAITSGLIAYFVHRLSGALREREHSLRLARDRESRARRVASLTTLAAGAAHELGTPLGTIALVAGELEARIDNVDLKRDVAVIRTEVGRCRSILDAIHTEAGDVIGEGMSSLDFDDFMTKVRLRLNGDRADRLDVSGEGTLWAPEQAFVQVVENLVSNGFDASDAAGRVHVALQDGVLEVRDEGEGMTAATLARLTEPYFTTKPEGEGTGLGLFLAAETVQAVGGAIQFESKLGEGTRVRIQLPLQQAAE